MKEDQFPYCLELASKLPVKFEELPYLLATALHPAESWDRAFAINPLKDKLVKAASIGDLIVRDPFAHEPLDRPLHQLEQAIVLTSDLRSYLSQWGVGLKISDLKTDMAASNFARKSNPKRKLSTKDEAEIRQKLIDGATVSSLATKYHVSRPTIDKYKAQKTRGTG